MQSYIRARLDITGRPPGLVLNNGQLADDTNEFAVKIRELVEAGRGKKKLTDEQRERKDLLNWRGSLYVNPEGSLYLPAVNLFKAIVLAAREFNLGTKIEDRGAITLGATELPLFHDGPDDLDKLWADSRFRFRTGVNPNPSSRNKSLLPLMRPVFPEWSVRAVPVMVQPEMINWDDFCKVIEASGNVGVGNARKIGYGRFDAHIQKLPS